MGGKQAAQCQADIGKANRVLVCIQKGIIYKSKEVVLTLYRNLVRAAYGILCAVLVTTTQEGQSYVEEFSILPGHLSHLLNTKQTQTYRDGEFKRKLSNTVFLQFLQYIETFNSYVVFSDTMSVHPPDMLMPQVTC